MNITVFGASGGESEAEDVRADENLDLAGKPGRRCGAVDGPDLVAALGGEADDMGADSAGSSEDGDVHRQEPPDCTG